MVKKQLAVDKAQDAAPLVPHANKSAKALFGDGETPRNTRERLIETALSFFYAYGFHAVGVDQIISAVGVTKTTFYNHFESKDALVIAAIERRSAWEAQTLVRMVRERAGMDPRAMLLSIFDVLDVWFNDPDYLGCLYINACAEFPLPEDPVHQIAAAHYAKAGQMIRELAQAVGASDPDAFAEQWVMLIQGAMTQRLVAGNDGAAAAARVMAEKLLADEAAT